MNTTLPALTAAVVLLAALRASPAATNIQVTFDALPSRPPGTVTHGNGYYHESGVVTMAVSSGFSHRWSGDPRFPDNGSAYIQPTASTQLMFLYTGRDLWFDAVSVDLALYSTASLEPVKVRVMASHYLGPPIFATAEFTIQPVVDSHGRPAFQTFYFPPDFRSLTANHRLYIPAGGSRFSLDNLVIFIPEPSTGALLALGLGGLLLARARRSGCPGTPAPARHAAGP